MLSARVTFVFKPMTKLDSNWSKLQKTLKKSTPSKRNGKKPTFLTSVPAQHTTKAAKKNDACASEFKNSAEFICDLIRREKGLNSDRSVLEPRANLTTVLAIDCEMVGVGPSTKRDALARVSIVNFYGEIVLDTLVKPMEVITDYRTKYSGIHRGDLLQAPTFQLVQQKVADIITGRILIAHSIRSDLKALMLSHPWHLIRDTTNRIVCGVGLKSLKNLSKDHLDLEIQEGSHNSVEDARAALALYRKFSVKWEKSFAQNQHQKRLSRPKGDRRQANRKTISPRH